LLAKPKGVRAVVLSAVLYLAFLNFAFVVRTASHLTYLMGSATGQLDAHQFPLARRTRTTAGDQSVPDPTAEVSSSQAASASSQRLPSGQPVDVDTLTRQITMETERRVEPPLQALEAADVAERSKKLIKLMSFHFSMGFRCVLPSPTLQVVALHYFCLQVLLLRATSGHVCSGPSCSHSWNCCDNILAGIYRPRMQRIVTSSARNALSTLTAL
jgi:hypothetical protein